MRTFLFVVVSLGAWGVLAPRAWCQQTPPAGGQVAQQGGQAADAGQSEPSSGGITSPSAQPGQTGTASPSAQPGQSGTPMQQGAQPGQSGTPMQQGAQPGQSGTPMQQGAQPGQSGTAESLQRRALDQQQLNDQQQFTEQQQAQQGQLDALNQPGQFLQPGGQFQSGRFGDRPMPGEQSVTRQGTSRMVDRTFAVDRLLQRGHRFDDWRIVEHSGRWWYWTPQREWLFFDNGNWVGFRPGPVDRGRVLSRQDIALPRELPPDEWRLVFHNGRWWYWAPDETWLYLDRGRWNPFAGQATAMRGDRAREQRYGVGYRGQVDRFEGPGARQLLRDGQMMDRRTNAESRTLDDQALRSDRLEGQPPQGDATSPQLEAPAQGDQMEQSGGQAMERDSVTEQGGAEPTPEQGTGAETPDQPQPSESGSASGTEEMDRAD